MCVHSARIPARTPIVGVDSLLWACALEILPPAFFVHFELVVITMVVKGCFKVELVDALTKKPYKEHVSKPDCAQYAEVEPDAEYLVSVQRIGVSQGGQLVYLQVDGQDIGYSKIFWGSESMDKPTQFGIMRGTNSDGNLNQESLKFVKPQGASAPNSEQFYGGRHALMGKIEVKVYEGVKRGKREPGVTLNVSDAFDQAKPVNYNQS